MVASVLYSYGISSLSQFLVISVSTSECPLARLATNCLVNFRNAEYEMPPLQSATRIKCSLPLFHRHCPRQVGCSLVLCIRKSRHVVSDVDKTGNFAIIGWSDVTVICYNITISMLWDNTAYCVKFSGGDLSRWSSKIESVGFGKCPYYH